MYRATTSALWVFLSLFLRTAYTDELSVLNYTGSSVILSWKITYPEDSYVLDGPLAMNLRYTPILSDDQRLPSKLQRRTENKDPTYFDAADDERIYGISKEWNIDYVYAENFQENLQVNVVGNNTFLVTVSKLPYYNTTYEFVFTRTFKRRLPKFELIQTVNLTQRTTFGVPMSSPKVMAGSFRIVNVTAVNRTVTVYWRTPNSTQEQYEARIFEDGKSIPVATLTGELAQGSVTYTISLNRHYFRLKSVNSAGSSEEVSIVDIPHQGGILPPPPQVSFFDKTENVTVLIWAKLDGVFIDNYTIFWVTGDDGLMTLESVRDVARVDHDQTSLEVRREDGQRVLLAMSVNYLHASSGMHLVRPCDLFEWPGFSFTNTYRNKAVYLIWPKSE